MAYLHLPKHIIFHINSEYKNFLHCLQVSWIRVSDLKLLTVGRYTYTTDLRFEGIHQKYSPDWKLVLSGAHAKDSGKIGKVFWTWKEDSVQFQKSCIFLWRQMPSSIIWILFSLDFFYFRQLRVSSINISTYL